MKFTETNLKGSYVIDVEPYSDERGWFTRYFDLDEFKSIGHTESWKQMNHSFTALKGSIRGMHYQFMPFAEIKQVRCIAGAAFDVIIDLRNDSPTFLKWFGQEISAANKKMMYIPQGFAHGFQTLSDNCELMYHHSEYFKPGFEGGIKYSDPMINIEWPTEVTSLSARDSTLPFLTEDFEGIKFN